MIYIDIYNIIYIYIYIYIITIVQKKEIYKMTNAQSMSHAHLMSKPLAMCKKFTKHTQLISKLFPNNIEIMSKPCPRHTSFPEMPKSCLEHAHNTPRKYKKLLQTFPGPNYHTRFLQQRMWGPKRGPN